MGSTHLDENNLRTESPQETPEQYALTYLLGPPTRGVDAIAFAEVAASKCLPPEVFWVGVVSRAVARLIESDAEGRSILDDMFSEALGQSVTLWEVEGTVSLQGERRLPGLIIQSQKVLDALGRPAARRLADREILTRIAKALMGFTRADWAICSISDGKSEFLFPILRAGKVEDCDA